MVVHMTRVWTFFNNYIYIQVLRITAMFTSLCSLHLLILLARHLFAILKCIFLLSARKRLLTLAPWMASTRYLCCGMWFNGHYVHRRVSIVVEMVRHQMGPEQLQSPWWYTRFVVSCQRLKVITVLHTAIVIGNTTIFLAVKLITHR